MRHGEPTRTRPRETNISLHVGVVQRGLKGRIVPHAPLGPTISRSPRTRSLTLHTQFPHFVKTDNSTIQQYQNATGFGRQATGLSALYSTPFSKTGTEIMNKAAPKKSLTKTELLASIVTSTGVRKNQVVAILDALAAEIKAGLGH